MKRTSREDVDGCKWKRVGRQAAATGVADVIIARTRVAAQALGSCGDYGRGLGSLDEKTWSELYSV